MILIFLQYCCPHGPWTDVWGTSGHEVRSMIHVCWIWCSRYSAVRPVCWGGDDNFGKAAQPGKFLVDAFPICEYLHSEVYSVIVSRRRIQAKSCYMVWKKWCTVSMRLFNMWRTKWCVEWYMHNSDFLCEYSSWRLVKPCFVTQTLEYLPAGADDTVMWGFSSLCGLHIFIVHRREVASLILPYAASDGG